MKYWLIAVSSAVSTSLSASMILGSDCTASQPNARGPQASSSSPSSDSDGDAHAGAHRSHDGGHRLHATAAAGPRPAQLLRRPEVAARGQRRRVEHTVVHAPA